MTSPRIDLNLEGDGAWPDLAGREILDAGSDMAMTVLDAGMSSGRPAIAIRIDLDERRSVLVQTSPRALVAAVRAILARYPDPEILAP